MRSYSQLILLPLLLLVAITTSEVQAKGPIVPKNAKLEKLFEGITLTEGVAVAPNGMVYFSDITFSHQAVLEPGAIHAGHIWKFENSRLRNTGK